LSWPQLTETSRIYLAKIMTGYVDIGQAMWSYGLDRARLITVYWSKQSHRLRLCAKPIPHSATRI